MQFIKSKPIKPPVYGVILAGGEGKRLWPVSRKRIPKYSLSLGAGSKSLLQGAYERLRTFIDKDKIFVITQLAQTNTIKKQLPFLNNKNIIIEPFARNTSAAISLSAIIIGKINPDAVMVVVPADHFIPEKIIFKKIMDNAVKAASFNNSLVTIGIKPTCPATGYGYIKTQNSKRKAQNKAVYKVKKFIEKPDLIKAKKFIKQGYLWNSGIFVWEITAILEALRDYAPDLLRQLSEVDAFLLSNKTHAWQQSNFRKILLKSYKKIKSVSIDYAVLEKSDNVFVIPADLKWDDVGSWLSLNRMLKRDKDGNVITANFKGIDTKNCIISSNVKNHLIAAYGLKDVIIISTPDATLVCSGSKADKLKELVSFIENNKKTERFC